MSGFWDDLEDEEAEDNFAAGADDTLGLTGLLSGLDDEKEAGELRDELVPLSLPWLRVYGRLDSLVPKASIALLDERYPASHSVVLEKASHAPFISHPQQFIEIVRHFVG